MTPEELRQRFEAARAAELAGTQRPSILPEPGSADFPGALRAAREFLRLTQDELSKEAGLDGNQPGRHERGLSEPRHETWQAEDDALFRVYVGRPKHIRRPSGLIPITEEAPGSKPMMPAETLPEAAGLLLCQATIEQIAAECRSRGATITLQFT